MPYASLLTVCVSLIVGLCGVASIFVSGWVKASQLNDLREVTETKIDELRKEVNNLWEKVSKVEVLSSKIESVEKGIDEIKAMLRDRRKTDG